MDETRSQLSDKLSSLEHQVSATVQTTGTAVNATVEAVQQTVETVTDAARDTVQYVRRAFDIPRHVERHPWLALGGSVVLGYLAAEFLTRAKKQGAGSTAPSSPLPAPSQTRESAEPEVQTAATDAALAAAYESGSKISFWREMRTMAIGALIGIAEDVISHAVPPVMDYLAGKRQPVATGEPTVAEADVDPLRRSPAPVGTTKS
jgi:hypothetical protein